MKRISIVLMILILSAGLCANPVVPRLIARVWWGSSGNFNVYFGDEMAMLMDYSSLYFSSSYGNFRIPDGFSFPSLPYFVALNQIIPAFQIDRDEDFFTAHMGDWVETIAWGPQNDLSVNMHAIPDGMSAVQTRVEGEYGLYNAWALTPTSMSSLPYDVNSSFTIDIQVTAFDGSPASLVPVFLSYDEWENTIYTTQFTNSEGICQITSVPTRVRVIVLDPVDGSHALDSLIFPLPNEHYDLEAQFTSVSSHDPVFVPGALTLWPSVISSRSGNILRLKSEGLGRDALLKLYDLRGRYLCSQTMPASGELEWQIPDLESGIYLLRLVRDDMALSSARFTVLK